MINYRWLPMRTTSLHSRVTHTLFALVLAFFLLFSLSTLFIVLGFEDITFQLQLQQLKNTTDYQQQLPERVSHVKSLADVGFTPSNQLKYFEFDNDKPNGEFSIHGRHYHYLQTDQGYLLLDTTDQGLVQRTLDDIVMILVVSLLPVLLLTYILAKRISAYAIHPFTLVSQILTSPSPNISDLRASLERVREEDIRELALTVADAVEEKRRTLDREITFNQGMAHELRTPLQVMAHSTELLQLNNPDLNRQASFTRLQKSQQRMTRISEAMLWLTAVNQQPQATEAEPLIRRVLDDSQALLSAHTIDVDLNVEQPLILPLPETVLELIVHNLLTNVVNHCAQQPEKLWRITMTTQHLTFANCFNPNEASSAPSQGFGLGLDLVKKLSEKFGLDVDIQSDERWFEVTLSWTDSENPQF